MTNGSSQLRILFVLRHPLYLRLYESLLEQLTARGHACHLAFTHGYPDRDEGVVLAVVESCPGMTWEYLPPRRNVWRTVGDVPRSVIDYWRYLEPQYREAERLRERARRKVAPGVRAVASHPALVVDAKRRAVIAGWLRKIEPLIPIDTKVRKLVRTNRPDLVLVTPLVDLSYEQVDVVKAARSAGIPSALLVASWDNLTNKGLIHVAPDSVVVWNEAQRVEAVQMHGIPRDRVQVTGAAVYDQWFGATPTSTRAELFDRHGLDKGSALVTYVGSSGFIARNERNYVFQWLLHLRSATDERLRNANVIIRPHPQNAAQWAGLELPAGVVVWPAGGAVPLTAVTKSEYFDTLFHSDAVVGINTSAFIEAGVIGRRVLTITTPDVRATQVETLHFHHLVNHGLLEVSATFHDHLEQLAAAITEPDGRALERAAFVKEFVRPDGSEMCSTAILADAVEAASRRTPASWRTPAIGGLLRALVAPVAALAEGARRLREQLRSRG